ncbi:putative anti-sigma F factor antagonist [Vibrio ichthyoenteri ATCC 700023]|uniref:Putative anti-sigma F factor antagonist n=1 Tax=Vibrio ichthyoenteri ATCC 700023 TaxID=870968 RepID=F9S770_9VIBR|nr:ATP-binding protein [Vibrio ichthyoenteri]EGU31957.1 putative anti-sigma F factor antagonist [Vibrio ichthyoenteri ATCC 700023]
MTNSHSRHFGNTYLSSLDASRDASEDLQHFCSLVGISNELAAQLELCVVEIVNNAFIHAYNEQEGQPIELQCEIQTDSSQSVLLMAVSDYGCVMSQQEFENKLATTFIEPDPEDDATWATSGRGFIIVSSLMDTVKLSTQHTKNTFLMVKALEEQALTV